MYYRMTRLHWRPEDYDGVVSRAAALQSRIESIQGLLFAELIDTGEGEGMIIAAYRSEADYRTAADEVASIFDDLDEMLTATPHGHEGTSVLSFGEAPGSD
ncbi:MAG: hypothetical protein R3258_05100 [Acidimicrobiia bacterium]|nr:hypothetical protein [Acidimicrobiia bacterium]